MRNCHICILMVAVLSLLLAPQAFAQIEDLLTPLMLFAKEGDIEALKLDSLDTLDDQSQKGMTALHFAVRYSKEEAACFLIERGANPLILDALDETPLSIARKQKLTRVVEALERSIIEGRHLGIHDTSKDKHFIVLVASYNNEKWAQVNLSSILNQDYSKFTIVYLNDVSTDSTAEKVESVISSFQAHKRVILVNNKVKRWCLGNYIFAVERFCPNGSILVLVDGDDWLRSDDYIPYNRVLATLNEVYQDPNIWITFGDSCVVPANYKTPHCHDISGMIASGNFRQQCQKQGWPIHHLRTFYAALFRKIKQSDFLDVNGQIFKFTEDVAFMLPMIEMAGTRVKFLPYLWYAYNIENPLITTNTVSMNALGDTYKFICEKKPYNKIDDLYMFTPLLRRRTKPLRISEEQSPYN